MSGGENVPVGDEDAAAVLIVAVAQQGGHPRPLAFISRFSADDPGVEVLAVLATARAWLGRWLGLGFLRRRLRRFLRRRRRSGRRGARRNSRFIFSATNSHVAKNNSLVLVHYVLIKLKSNLIQLELKPQLVCFLFLIFNCLFWGV